MATSEQPKIKLHWLEKSRAQSILWLLEELKVPYEIELYHRKPDMLAPDSLKKVHPLGKSPLMTITPAGSTEPVVMAESGFITQYLCEHFAKDSTLMPTRYKEGKEGQPGGETEQWMRWQYFLHFVEGTMFPNLILAMVFGRLKGSDVPFLVRPITSVVANQVFSQFILPNTKLQLGFLEQQLSTSGGDYLCGEHLTGADILISFGLISAKPQYESFGKWDPKKDYPKTMAYIDRLETHPGWKKSTEKIAEIDASYGIKF